MNLQINNVQKIIANVRNVYDHAIEIHKDDYFLLENPYHRQFSHPYTSYKFLREARFQTSLEKLSITPPLITACIIHDLANLYSDYTNHELELVYLMIEIDQEHEHQQDLNNQIKQIYNHRPAPLRTISDKSIKREIKNVLDYIYNIYFKENKIEYWDKIKIFILGTMTGYLREIISEQSIIVDDYMHEMISNKTTDISSTKLQYLIEEKLTDSEIEDPSDYLLFDNNLHNIAKVYSEKNNEDLNSVINDIFYIRLADFGHFFSPEDYSQQENNCRIFLDNTKNDVTSLRNKAQKSISSNQADISTSTSDITSPKTSDSINWNTRQLNLALNLYLFVLRLKKQRIIELNESLISKLQTVILEILSRCWAL